MRWNRIRSVLVLLVGLAAMMQPVPGLAKLFVVASTLDMADIARHV